MKKIIGGRKYNTETATEIAVYENDFGRSDFKYMIETLYKKKTGEFFLYGEGGPMSKYAAEAYGGGRTSGEAIVPLTEAETKKWAEEHMDVDAYEELFGEVEE